MPLIVTRIPHTRQPQFAARLRPDWLVAWNFGAGVRGLSSAPPITSGAEGVAVNSTPTYAGFSSDRIVPGISGNTITVVMLLEPTGITTASNFLFAEAASGGGAYNYGFYQGGSGSGHFFIHNGTDGIPTSGWSGLAAPRGPVCLVGTYDGSTIRLYADGIEVGSAAQTGNIRRDASANLAWSVWAATTMHARFYGGAVSARLFSAKEIANGFRTVSSAWGRIFSPMTRRIVVPSAATSAVPTITAVSAENITATSADYRVTLDFA